MAVGVIGHKRERHDHRRKLSQLHRTQSTRARAGRRRREGTEDASHARRLRRYKYPRVVWIADELPEGATGKIVKRAIVPPAGLDLR